MNTEFPLQVVANADLPMEHGVADGLPEAAAANSEGALTPKSKRRKTQREYAQRKREKKKEADKDNPAKEKERKGRETAARKQRVGYNTPYAQTSRKRPRQQSGCVCESTFIEWNL